MSDYPMLISNKLHSFRNFTPANDHMVPAVMSSVFGDTPYFMMKVVLLHKYRACMAESKN